MEGSIQVTAYVFDNTGNQLLRTEELGIPMPAIFIPAKAPILSLAINSKILYGDNFSEECYVAETVDELYEMANGGGVPGVPILAIDTIPSIRVPVGTAFGSINFSDYDLDTVISIAVMPILF